MTDSTPTTYILLAQLSANYRRLKMTATASLVDAEHAALRERFGPLEVFPVPPRAPWLVDFLFRLAQYRSRAENGDQYGRVDHCTVMICDLTISLCAQAAREGVELAPRHAERIMASVRNAVTPAFERIKGSVGGEGGAARFSQKIAWQAHRQEVFREQKRSQEVAQLQATQARLKALLADEAAS